MADAFRQRGRSAVVLVGVALAVVAVPPAEAATQLELHPAALLAAGVDDNPLFNGSGNDQIGRVGLGLDLKSWDRSWSVALNANASLYGFRERQKLVPLGESTLNASARFDRWNVVSALARVRGSDDPLGLAQIGLLTASGSVIGFRSFLEYEHLFEGRWSMGTVATYDGIAFLAPTATQQTGTAAGLGAQPRFRLTRDLTLQMQAGGRVFLSQGIQGYTVGAAPGVRYRIARRFFAEADVGPTFFHDTGGFVPLPVVKGLVEYDDRHLGARLTASQDLAVPNGRAGVLLMELVEAMVRWSTLEWELRGRGGYYRSLSSPRANDWQPGYGFQVEAFRRLTSFMWLGVSALRFERLSTQSQQGMARDAVYLQLEFTQDRP